jgi:hypothetical protein
MKLWNYITYYTKYDSQICEWMSDCSLTPIQQFHGEKKLIFNEMMTLSTLY